MPKIWLNYVEKLDKNCLFVVYKVINNRTSLTIALQFYTLLLQSKSIGLCN